MSDRMLKRLVGALGAVAAVWLVVFFVSRGSGDDAPPVTGPIAAFFENVDSSNMDAARFIRARDTVELRNVAGAWLVSGFRSDSGAVSRFFGVLRDTEVEGIAATNPSNHGRMGLADTAAAMEIDQAGATRRILVGVEGPRPGTFYARLPDEDAVYLVDSGIRSYVFRQLDDWRNRRMIALDTSQVRRIVVQRDGQSATIVRTDTTGWMFTNGDTARTPTVQAILNELAGGLVASRFLVETDSIARLPQGGSTTAYSATGEQLAQVTVGSGSGDRWGMVAGDSVRYRLPPFRVDLIVPRIESLRPQ